MVFFFTDWVFSSIRDCNSAHTPLLNESQSESSDGAIEGRSNSDEDLIHFPDDIVHGGHAEHG